MDKDISRSRRRYTADEKRAVVKDARELGVTAAARAHGTCPSNVSRWLADGSLGEVGASTPAGLAKPAESNAAELPGPSARRKKGKERSLGDPAARAPAAVPAPCKAEVGPSRKAKGQSLGEPPGVPNEQTKNRLAKIYTPSQRAAVVEYASSKGVSNAAKKFGASRFAIYSWIRQLKKAAAGEGDAPTAGEPQAEVEARRDQEILDEWHKHPGLGPSQIRNQLRRRGVKVSVHTTRRVMEDAGYRPPKVIRKPHDERFEAVRPNHLWHLDFFHRNINRASTFTLILLDDRSRFVVGHGVDDAERADLVIETFEEAVRRHGRPEMVLHDKGAAFWSWRGISRFTALLTELGIDQIPAEHKEWNGKLEVFNGNIKKELFDVHRFYDVAEMRRRLTAHLDWYNHERTSQALGGLLVPADRYYGREEQVLARIEAGAGRDNHDVLDLRGRTLELFKIVSTNGAPEAWLMGKKILDLGE